MKVVIIMEILAVIKQEAQKYDGERIKLRMLNVLDVRKQYQSEISNRFAALENLSDEEEINRFWENIEENTENSAKYSLVRHELKHYKQSFVEECLGLWIKKFG
jgi:hypothetical protein